MLREKAKENNQMKQAEVLAKVKRRQAHANLVPLPVVNAAQQDDNARQDQVT